MGDIPLEIKENKSRGEKFKAETLALRVIAERLEQGEANPTSNQLTIE